MTEARKEKLVAPTLRMALLGRTLPFRDPLVVYKCDVLQKILLTEGGRSPFTAWKVIIKILDSQRSCSGAMLE